MTTKVLDEPKVKVIGRSTPSFACCIAARALWLPLCWEQAGRGLEGVLTRV